MNKRLILFLFLSTAVLALASFGVMLALSRRPAAPTLADTGGVSQPQAPGVSQLAIDGTFVTVSLAPEKEIRLISELNPFIVEPPPTTAPDAGQPDVLAPVPTETPFVADAQPTVAPAPAVNTAQPIIFVSYLVQQGDTLFSIAAAQNSGVALMATHGIDSEDIQPGATINLPVANPAYCPGRRPYVVREGDTAFSIGRRFNTTHEVLQQINGLDANFTIRIGEVICVP